MLRGSNVLGRPTAIPDSHVGMVVIEDKLKQVGETRTFKQSHQFQQYVLWDESLKAMRTGDTLTKSIDGYCLAEEVSWYFVFDSMLYLNDYVAIQLSNSQLHTTVDPIELQLFLIAEQPDESPSPATLSTTVSTVGSSENVDRRDRLDDFACESADSRSLFTASPKTLSTSLSAGGSAGGSTGSVNKLVHDDENSGGGGADVDGGVVKMDIGEEEKKLDSGSD